MELNQENIDRSQDMIDTNERIMNSQNLENINYLYPNGHRMTNQMRWFKGSRDRGSKSDRAA
jgi:hypothetical protein